MGIGRTDSRHTATGQLLTLRAAGAEQAELQERGPLCALRSGWGSPELSSQLLAFFLLPSLLASRAVL